MLIFYENKVHSGIILSAFASIFWIVHISLLLSVIPFFGFFWSLALSFGIASLFTLLHGTFAKISFASSDMPHIFIGKVALGSIVSFLFILSAYYSSLLVAGSYVLGSYFFLLLFSRRQFIGTMRSILTISVIMSVGFFHFFIGVPPSFLFGSLAGLGFALLHGVALSIGLKHPYPLSFFELLFVTLLFLVLALLFNSLPTGTPQQWIALAASGFFLFLMHYYFHYAYTFASVYTVGATGWSGFFLTLFIQLLLWDQYPNMSQVLGCILVFCAFLALSQRTFSQKH